MLLVSDAWKTTYPGAAVGILAMRGVANPEHHPALEQRKEELENELRARFVPHTGYFAGHDRAALKELPILAAYEAYYRRFKKTYHVQLQLESVVFKGKSIPRVAALVEAMFMAELKHLLLTAGHDLDALQPPIQLDVAKGQERYLRINGDEEELKAGDMFIADAQGVMSSVLYGPDWRTRIMPATRRVFFSVYAPPGISHDAVRQHLLDIQANVMLIAPDAQIEEMQVYTAQP